MAFVSVMMGFIPRIYHSMGVYIYRFIHAGYIRGYLCYTWSQRDNFLSR